MGQDRRITLLRVARATALMLGAGSALGQDGGWSMSPPASRDVEVGLDSGWVAHSGATPGPEVVWAGIVEDADASWARLWFDGIWLAGDPARLDASRLRLTSLADGATQELDAQTAARWNASSAYFNGGAVLVEIIAWPETGACRVTVGSMTAGEPAIGPRSICGPTDDRVLSNDPRAARYLPSGCSAWLINDTNRQFLSAGHCGISTTGIVQFNVPLSSANGSLNHPPPQDQYPVEPSSIQAAQNGLGDDWAYFGCWPNSSNESAFERQGQSYVLAPSVPAPTNQVIRVTGYGTVSSPVSPTWNQVQKTHTGFYLSRSGTTLRYNPDTTGGNSGSAVFNENTGQAIGIHTNGGCSSTGGSNAGCSLDNAGLRNALANPRGICSPGFGVVTPPVYAAGDSNRAFGSVNFQGGTFTRVSVLPAVPEGMAYDWNRDVFWVTTSDRRLHRVARATSEITLVGTNTGTDRPVNGLAYDPWTDTLYGIHQTGGRMLILDKDTGAVTPIGAPGQNNVGALEFDPFTRTIFGIDDAPGASRLIRLDPATGAQTVVGPLGLNITDCNGLAYNPDDRMLYAINAANERLVKINPVTGAATDVGPTGVLWGASYGMSAVIDRPCPADFNADGFVDFFDLDAFVQCFDGQGCPPGKIADFNADGFIDFFDLDAYVAAFEAGC
ncbi:MAG: SMP-30/gluconolactonase/LRE family protein [Phycisphaeraceae bacterium]|nr:MAG: SMP-30/gluconolactonase/LRE family protein [Phycisphaeraceae bacterium]